MTPPSSRCVLPSGASIGWADASEVFILQACLFKALADSWFVLECKTGDLRALPGRLPLGPKGARMRRPVWATLGPLTGKLSLHHRGCSHL